MIKPINAYKYIKPFFINFLFSSTKFFAAKTLVPSIPDAKMTIFDHSEIDMNGQKDSMSNHLSFLKLVEKNTTNFDEIEFVHIVNYFRINQINDERTHLQIERILVENRFSIDWKTKHRCAELLVNSINECPSRLDEELFVSLFKSLLEDRMEASFKDFLLTLRQLTTVFKHFKSRPLLHPINDYIENKIYEDMKLKQIYPKTLADLITLVKMIEMGFLHLGSVIPYPISETNKILERNMRNVNLNSALMIVKLMSSYVDHYNSNVETLFKDSVPVIFCVIRKYVSNYSLLIQEKQRLLVNNINSIISFYKNFVISKGRKGLVRCDIFEKELATIFLKKLNEITHSRLKDEIKDLFFFANVINYKDKEFWQEIADIYLDYLSSDMKADIQENLNRTLPFEVLRKGTESNISLMFHYGILLDTFTTIEVGDTTYWQAFFSCFNEFVNTNDPKMTIQFIYAYCYRLYTKKDYKWDLLVAQLPENHKQIFSNPEITKDFVESYFLKGKMNLADLKKAVDFVFQDKVKVSNLEVFLTLIEGRLEENKEVLKLVANLIVNCLENEENDFISNLKVLKKVDESKSFKTSQIKDMVFESLKERKAGERILKIVKHSKFLDRLYLMKLDKM